MSGKKVAIMVVGITIIVSILVAIALSIFFATYEPKQTINVNKNDTEEIQLEEDQSK